MTQTEDSPTGKAPEPTASAHVPHLMLAVRTRRVLELIGVLAGTTLFWSWMLMPNSTLRSVVTVSCAIALLSMILLVFGLQTAAGKPERERVLAELGAMAASQEKRASGVLPGRLRGGRTRYVNMTASLFALVLCGGLPFVLGLGNPVPTGKAVALNKAGVERSWR